MYLVLSLVILNNKNVTDTFVRFTVNINKIFCLFCFFLIFLSTLDVYLE